MVSILPTWVRIFEITRTGEYNKTLVFKFRTDVSITSNNSTLG